MSRGRSGLKVRLAGRFQLAAAIATGFPCPVISHGKDEEELEKRLGASLLAGHPILSIDNISQDLGGDCLCQLLDQPVVKVRILGQSSGPLIEPRICLFATGNIVRRAVVARMDAGREDPWLRQFNDDPLVRVAGDRGKYVAAALTVCRAFMASGEAPLPVVAHRALGAGVARVRRPGEDHRGSGGR